MQTDISFPHLGISLETVGREVSVFGFKIAYYGIIVACSIMAGLAIVLWRAKKTRQDTEDYYNMAIFGILFGILGARIYYVIFSFKEYKGDWLSILNLRQGGLAIYGGIIGAILVMFVYTKKKELSFFKVADTVVFGLVTGQMLGRWGNFFNREAFGDYTDGLFAMRLPVDDLRRGDITEKMCQNSISIDGISYIQAHPTFLYESLWCLGLLLFLLYWSKRKCFRGELFFIYLGGYSLGRVWIEGLRTDQLLLPWIGVPVSQVLAGILVILCGIMLYTRGKPGKYLKRNKNLQGDTGLF